MKSIESIESEKSKILDHFDEVFESDLKEHLNQEMPLLKYLFEKFSEDLYKPSEKYERIRKQQIKIADKLHPMLTEEQEKLFQEYWQLTNQLASIEDEQLFYAGYLIARKLDMETKMSRD